MDYKKMYLSLFNSITDSLNALESLNFGQAADILRAGAERLRGAIR